MKFKTHPYYDDSDAEDWLYLRPDDWTELEPGAEKTLQDLLRAHKPRLCELALSRILEAAGAGYVAERPHPDVIQFLFFPIDDHGYRVYIEYFFSQRPDESSPDSDYWWVIINSPYAVVPYPDPRVGQADYVIGLGWRVS